MFKNLSSRKKVLISMLFLVSIISTVWLYLKSKDSVKVNVLPTPVPVKFEYIKAIPASGSISTIPVTSNVEFYFSKPIDEATADVTISPNTAVTFSSSVKDNAFYIRAVPSWSLGQKYTIKLKIKSKEGQTLPNEINYTFELEKMTNSLLSE